MKVAILFPGLTRSYKDSYDSFYRNVYLPNIKNHEIDIYTAFWDHTHVRDFKHPSGRKKPIPLSECEINEIINMFKPFKYEVMRDYHEKNSFFKDFSKSLIDIIGLDKYHHNPRSLVKNSVIAQTYVWNKAFSLVEGDYDLILKNRFDVLFHDKIIFEDFDLNSFNCAGKIRKKKRDPKKKETQWEAFGLCDLVFGSNPSIMKNVMQDYHSLVLSRSLPKTDRVIPEVILKNLLISKFNIPIKPINNAAFLEIRYE